MDRWTFYVALELLMQLGFVPNKRNNKYHTASVTIDGKTVWCKDFDSAMKISNRVMSALYKRGLNPRYRVEDAYGRYMYNW